MSPSQNDMGRAFEYGLVNSISMHLGANIIHNSQLDVAEHCFQSCSEIEQQHIDKASDEAVNFLVKHDNRLSGNKCNVSMQPDKQGILGDVRDIIIHNDAINADIGISAKNRHGALKHSRLSEHIDFGSEWFGIHCSDEYFLKILPLFEELKKRRKNGENWKEISDKKQRYYLPVLEAFHSELETLFKNHSDVVAKKLVKYLLGKYDYYKVIKENGEVKIMSFNIDGSLKWGKKLLLPAQIVKISQKTDSETTLEMIFDQGWTISFRIHNASTKVEPSLKFDINIIGQPGKMSSNSITYR